MNCRCFFNRATIFLIMVLLALFNVNSLIYAYDTNYFPENSILRSGSWYKIKVKDEGVYKITYEDLISIGISNPSSARIFGNGGNQLSYMNDDYRPNDLLETPVYTHKGSDGIFGAGDYILFYAKGSISWEYLSGEQKFKHSKHHYSEYSYYFITSDLGQGKPLAEIDESDLASTHTVSSYNYFDCYEVNTNFYIESGRTWFGESFESHPFSHSFEINEIESNSEIYLDYAFAVRSGSNRVVEILSNSEVIKSITTSKIVLSEIDHGRQADYKEGSVSVIGAGSVQEFTIQQTNTTITDKSYLDYLRINTRKKLQMHGEFLVFRDAMNIGEEKVGSFTVANADVNLQVWDITTLEDVRMVKGTLSGSNYTFTAKTDKLREFLALNVNGNYPSPIFKSTDGDSLGFIKNQNLHAYAPHELIIVAHPLFMGPAQELAQFHREKDNMSVLVVTPNTIYNEFSSGKPDVSAIRNFARLQYLKSQNSAVKFKYLMLFGDGSFINHETTEGNTNYILTYQSVESTSISSSSYVTDDFFGLLDSQEGEAIGMLDIGVGRLPVAYSDKDNTEVFGVVNKIKEYYKAGTMKNWRNQICFVGDDGEGGEQALFMSDMDDVAMQLKSAHPEFNFDKLYLDAYQQISSSSGPKYPDVESEIDRLFNKGILIFNYMGHGGENQITQEQVLDKSDLELIENAPNFPLFITATCQFGRYDQVKRSGAKIEAVTSAAEAAFLNSKGGAIALFTTSRQVYQSSNKALNENMYKYLFSKDGNGEKYRLGDVMRLAKNATGTGDNKLNFALLGDPAIKLAYPEYKVRTDSINSHSVNHLPDTISAFDLVTVSGSVNYDDGSLIDDFNGQVSMQVYDKTYMVTTNGNDNIATFDFEVQKNILFQGKATVTNGKFTISFVVPKDNSYSYQNGKLSFYAQNGVIDARGTYENFVIGGTSKEVKEDYDGPQLELFMNDESFVDGGITNASPELLVQLFDENGINTTGVGIGHDLVGVLDADEQTFMQTFILNDYFETDLNYYNKGSVRFPMSNIAAGHHTINVKVWDLYNNSSENSISFVVQNGDGLVLERLYNYPNPFNVETHFRYEHNQPGVEHKVRLDVFDMSGRLVYAYTRTLEENSFVSEPIYWNGFDTGGNKMPSGVYPYRLIIETPQTSPSIISEKLIIINY